MKLHKHLIFSLLVAAMMPTMAHSVEALPDGNTVIGQVGDKKILLKEIENREINELRVKLYEALQQAFISRALDDLRALSPVYSALQPATISDADIATFYSRNRLEDRGSLADMSGQIRSYMEGMAEAQSGAQIYQLATGKGDLQSYLSEPNEFLIKLPVETAYLRGNPQAKVMMMEFSDYQCPYCQRVQATIRSLIEQYGDRVTFGYRHFPLEFHQQADEASVAVECAREQNKFDPMHEALFKQQQQQSMDDLKALAKQVAMPDYAAFESCLSADTYRERIERDIKVGKAAGISGTPGFIIGLYDEKNGTLSGELLSGAQPASAFSDTLEKYLARSSTAQ